MAKFREWRKLVGRKRNVFRLDNIR